MTQDDTWRAYEDEREHLGAFLQGRSVLVADTTWVDSEWEALALTMAEQLREHGDYDRVEVDEHQPGSFRIRLIKADRDAPFTHVTISFAEPE